MYWFDPKTPAEVGPTDHVRGQVYFANPDDKIRALYKNGAISVRLIHADPSWLAN
jgi:hypothetical protein